MKKCMVAVPVHHATQREGGRQLEKVQFQLFLYFL